MRLLKKIRKSLHKFVSFVIGGIYKILSRIGIFTPKVVVYMDGGICSQMNQFLIGQIYATKGEIVYYDLKWFTDCGVDVNGIYKRIYELEEAFPYLDVKTIDGFERWFYRMFLNFTSSEMKLPNNLKRNTPIYLGGYYNIPAEEFVEEFKNTFRIPSDYSLKLKDRLNCAIHVRRGDLAKGDNPFYGGCSDSYFVNAIALIQSKQRNVKYFFFSDEMEYVISNIIPKINNTIDYELITTNKAYEDLFQIAICDIVIASQGSFGKFASMFNDETLLILKNDQNDLNKKNRIDWSKRKGNLIFVDE